MQDTADTHSRVKGWRTDADPRNEPTYPIRHRLAPEEERRTWQRPTQQPIDIEVLRSIERPNVTAVFGTSTPPSGLSGTIRRIAFRYSESSYLHWLPLVLADRIGVVEGLLDDLAHGHLPNIFAELGGKADWQYNKSNIVRRIIVGAALTSTALAYARTRKDARYTRQDAVQFPDANEPL